MLTQALKVLRIYTARWRIEDFHKAWKQVLERNVNE
jgi:hypothetical protein